MRLLRATVSLIIILTTVLLSAFFQPAFAKQNKIIVGSNVEVINEFISLYKSKDCRGETPIKSFKQHQRQLFELVILCRAFRDTIYYLDIVNSGNYERTLLLTKNGQVDIHGETIWLAESDNRYFYLTSALLNKSDIEFGLFFKKGNQNIHSSTSFDDLKRLSAVTQLGWKIDRKILAKLAIRDVYYASNTSSMFKMVDRGRVDFMLWSFSGQADLSIFNNDIKLIPIENLKVSALDSRHFAISKKSRYAFELAQIISKYLLKIRKSGELERNLIKSNIKSPYVSHWQIHTLTD